MVHSQHCATITYIYIQNRFMSPKGNPKFIKQYLFPTPLPSPATNNALSLPMDLPINGIIQYVTFFSLNFY